MQHSIRFSFILAIICWVAPFSSTLVLAQGKSPIETTITSDYLIDESGLVEVDQRIRLVNQDSSIYATKYALEIGSPNVDSIQVAFTHDQPAEFEVSQTQNSRIVTVDLSEKTVGKGRGVEFVVSYNQTDIAQLQGQVLEVNIPKINLLESTESQKINVIVPKKFGQPTILRPQSNQILDRDDYFIYSYTDNQKLTEGITAIFGKSQVMQFTLNYHLENPTVNKATTQIALPPDTPYQKVYYSKIDPQPRDVTLDIDGNWLATYLLEPKQKVDIVVQGQVELFLEPTVPIPAKQIDLNLYLKPTNYWPSDDPEVKKLAAELQTAEAIYEYLVETFVYNFERLDSRNGRLGGKQALQQPSDALCQEFTDAFISLARASGIPAREHNGFAYTSNPNLRPLSLVNDVLHAWPEYYDLESQQWIQVDPTWGNTTGGMDYFNSFDLNHFTFVIHGQNSETPYAAGYYRAESLTEKDILVGFSDQEPEQKIELTYHLEPNFLLLSGLRLPTRFSVANQGNTAIYNAQIDLSTRWKMVNSSLELPVVLPYSTADIQLLLRAPRPFFTKAESLQVNYANQTQTLIIELKKDKQILFIGALVSVVVCSGIFAYFAWGILVHRSKR